MSDCQPHWLTDHVWTVRKVLQLPPLLPPWHDRPVERESLLFVVVAHLPVVHSVAVLVGRVESEENIGREVLQPPGLPH